MGPVFVCMWRRKKPYILCGDGTILTIRMRERFKESCKYDRGGKYAMDRDKKATTAKSSCV